MSRQETNNTFSEGLIKDLNPINTPNTALTDCVNGTIITYDGNEYSLQNDRGNCGLEHCKLEPNYIPVGIKEYGDILYIVSYNPLNEHVQIGSYPSPKTIPEPKTIPDPNDQNQNTPSSGDMIIDIYSDLKKQYEIDQSKKEFSYQETVEKYSKLYVFYGENPDEMKMHEGDQVKLTVDGTSDNKFEKLQYVLINDNRQITDISDKIKPYIEANDYKSIAWGPGWFGFKPVIAEISDNIINIKKIKVPSYDKGNANLSFNVRVSTSDLLFIDSNELTLSRLKARIKLTGKDKNGNNVDIPVEDLPLDKFLDLKNGDYYYYSKDEEISNIDINTYSSITLEATPILYLDDNICITYNHLKRSSIFNLSTKGDPQNFLIGEGFWNWKTDTANNSIALTFDTIGLSQTSVLDEDIKLQYSITGLGEEEILDISGAAYTNRDCTEWSILGDTTIEFKTTLFTKENYEEYPNKLYTENIYKIVFKIVDKENNIIKEFSPKIIVATELLNSSSEARYDKVSIDTWLNNYIDSIKNTTFSIDYTSPDKWNIEPAWSTTYNKWLYPNKSFKANDKTYSTFLSNYELENIEKTDNITWNAKCNLSVECKSDIALLIGPMWLDFNDNCQVQFNEKTVKFDKFTGKLLEPIKIDVEGVSTKTIPCNLISIVENVPIWNYKETEVTYKELELTIDGKHSVSGNILESVASKQKCLDLIFKLKSNSSEIWSKTWQVVWWGSDIKHTTWTDTIVNNILSALKNYDLGLIKINVGKIKVDGSTGDFAEIGLSKTVDTGSESIINNNLKSGWDFDNAYKQFLVIKLNNNALFVEIPDAEWTNKSEKSKENIGYEAITRFCEEVKCIKVDDLDFTEGGFWKMILGDTIIKDSTSISINGILSFSNKLKIGDYNLLNKSNIPEGLYLSLDQYLFESIVLKSNKELIDIKASFSSTDTDELILRNSIDERNKSIYTEYSQYVQDKKYNSGFKYGTFYEDNIKNFTNGHTLVNYMNQKTYNGNNILFGWDKHTDWEKTGIIEKNIGKIANNVTLS